MRWAEIYIETTAQAQEAVSELMIRNGCGGVAIEGEAPAVVKCYLPVDDNLESRLEAIRTGVRQLPDFGIAVGSGELTVKYCEEKEWSEAWKQYFHATRIGSRIVIKPSWEDFQPGRSDVIIELDPGMAFGTGTHPTTRLCLQALEKYLRPRSVVVDFGTGSGILAIAAAKLGARLVIAFDVDRVAVESARANVVRNDLEERIEVHQADSPDFINLEADLVTANIVAETIIANAKKLADVLRVGGVLIASGITSEKSLDVEQALRNEGFDIVEIPADGEWVAIIARRAS